MLPIVIVSPVIAAGSAEVEVEVLLSSDFAHEETTTAMLTIRTNQDNKLFHIVSLYKTLKKKD